MDHGHGIARKRLLNPLPGTAPASSLLAMVLYRTRLLGDGRARLEPSCICSLWSRCCEKGPSGRLCSCPKPTFGRRWPRFVRPCRLHNRPCMKGVLHSRWASLPATWRNASLPLGCSIFSFLSRTVPNFDPPALCAFYLIVLKLVPRSSISPFIPTHVVHIYCILPDDETLWMS